MIQIDTNEVNSELERDILIEISLDFGATDCAHLRYAREPLFASVSNYCYTLFAACSKRIIPYEMSPTSVRSSYRKKSAILKLVRVGTYD